MKTLATTILTLAISTSAIASGFWNNNNGYGDGYGYGSGNGNGRGDASADMNFSFSFSGNSRVRGNTDWDAYTNGHQYGYYYGAVEDNNVYPYAYGYSPYGNYGSSLDSTVESK